MFDKQVAGDASGHPTARALRSLILLETSADPEPLENVPRYTLLNFIARWFGVRWTLNLVMPIMFGRTFMEDPARAGEREAWRRRLLNNRGDIWRAVNGVTYRRGIHDELPRIRTPTLVVVGAEDTATVPAKAERIHAGIAGSRFVKLPRGGRHTSSVEEPALVNAALEGFLRAQA